MSDELAFGGAKILVVGGSSGIGNAIAVAFRDRGADVCITGTRPSAELYAGEGAVFDGMHYRCLDAADASGVAVLSLPFETLSVLVNSQGLAQTRRQRGEIDIVEFQREIDVNLMSVAYLCARFRAPLAASRGSVVTVGSAACFVAAPHRLGYSAAKGGLVTLTKSLAAAWAKDGVRVNAIAPGYDHPHDGGKPKGPHVLPGDPAAHTDATLGPSTGNRVRRPVPRLAARFLSDRTGGHCRRWADALRFCLQMPGRPKQSGN